MKVCKIAGPFYFGGPDNFVNTGFDKSFVSKVNLGSCLGQIRKYEKGEVAKIMVLEK
jgi:hypothetical protein